MRKFLLILGALTFAFSANAQLSKKALAIDAQSVLKLEKAGKNMKLNKSQFRSISQTASASETRTATDTKYLIDWGSTFASDEDYTEIDDCSAISYVLTGATEEYQGATYNVATLDLDGSSWKMLIAQDGSKFILPAGQTDDTSAAEYEASLVLIGMALNDAKNALLDNTTDDIVYTRDDDNSNVYNSPFYGLKVIMAGGAYDGYYWYRKLYSTWLLPNGVENGKKVTSKSTSYSNPVYIYEKNNSIVVYNFNNVSSVQMSVANGKVNIPTGQHIMPISSKADKTIYGYTLDLTACNSDYDFDKSIESVEGEIAAPQYNEEGELTFVEAGNTISAGFRSLLGVASNVDTEGSYYGYYLMALTISLNKGNFQAYSPSAGISAVAEESSLNDGKFVKDNKIVINKNGKQYSTAGTIVK